MTKLDKPVTRETACVIQGRPVIVTLREGGRLIEFRLKGRRTGVYRVTVESCFWHALKASQVQMTHS